jgi:hypothetical protein
MKFLKLTAVLCLSIILSNEAFSQIEKKKITIKKINTVIKIDGTMDEAAWKDAAIADKFTELQPTPFLAESIDNATQVYFLYNAEGIYVGGNLHEKNKDSIAAELVGRDGFGNNDFLGVVFDTYKDKLNGFEYFVTPLGEQFDAKVSPSNNNSEDFSWNAVWQSASKINVDGWSFEMFIPYSAIRFGKKQIQDWGLNIVRKRQKSNKQLFWQSIDPNANGFLTQEGFMLGLQDIKPPLRLQFSPYFSTYLNHDGDTKKSTTTVNGGMDIKYGINQAMTLDMTLIPDFGQTQTDSRTLNLSPFEQRFSENRTFFTEGADLFSKGDLFYARRIGLDPNYSKYKPRNNADEIIEFPNQAKVLNATKISGRTQKGLGIGMLNAITDKQFATYFDTTLKVRYKEENMALTNYNILVLDQTLKNNSSISLVNSSVIRNGNDYDAVVTSGLFDFNNKKNTYAVGGNISISNLIGIENKPITGYAHSLYVGKTSGQFNFRIWQDLTNAKYDKNDFGVQNNNNDMSQGGWFGYSWNKPTKWYNRINSNFNFFYSRLVSPIDILKRKALMYQNAGFNINWNMQLKNFWYVGANISGGPGQNDFYEPRQYGRVFRDKGRIGMFGYWNSNDTKKLSWGGNYGIATGGVFNRKRFEYGMYGKVRFNSKFSIDYSINTENVKNQSGYAGKSSGIIYFSRRNLNTVENVINVKYSFTNKMGATLRARHYWAKVSPNQFYELDKYGDLQTPTTVFTQNVKQNYNFFSVDMVYTWQFAQGSFINVALKDIGQSFTRSFEKNYLKNLSNTVNAPQFTSLSLKVIYFLDYLTAKKKFKKAI